MLSIRSWRYGGSENWIHSGIMIDKIYLKKKTRTKKLRLWLGLDKPTITRMSLCFGEKEKCGFADRCQISWSCAFIRQPTLEHYRKTIERSIGESDNE